MVRPKKNDSELDAKEKILESFWSLLANNQLHEVSVGMIAAKAGCSRGTFYYHFSDKDELVDAAVEIELKNVPSIIFSLVSGVADIDWSKLSGNHMGRLNLFMEHGGGNLVERKVKDYVFSLWRVLLVPDGGDLKNETRMILEYETSGMLSLISYLGRSDWVSLKDFPAEFMKQNSAVALENICEVEQIPREEIILRLRMLNQLSKANQRQ